MCFDCMKTKIQLLFAIFIRSSYLSLTLILTLFRVMALISTLHAIYCEYGLLNAYLIG